MLNESELDSDEIDLQGPDHNYLKQFLIDTLINSTMSKHEKLDTNLENLARRIYDNNVAHGWWEGRTEKEIPELIALMHSELSEALEEYRKPEIGLSSIYFPEGKPEGFTVELADLLIRMLDILHGFKLMPVFMSALQTKLDYNESRPYRHGNKKC
jgi:hypothetical protein